MYYDNSAYQQSPAVTAISIIISIFCLVCMFRLFTKAGENGWWAICPIVNAYKGFKIAWGNGWLFLLLLIPFVNIVIIIIYEVYLAKSYGKSGAFAVGLIFLAPIFLAIMAFDDNCQYIGPKGEPPIEPYGGQGPYGGGQGPYDGYNNGGYNNGGYNNGGYNNGGYNNGGYNNGGYNNSGYNNGGYNNSGYNEGNQTNSGYNNSGYNEGNQNNGGYNNGGYNNGNQNNSDYNNDGYQQ